jgi:hypothetical protein
MVKITIEHDAPAGWVGGERVTGVVVVVANKPVVTRSVSIKLYGRERVRVDVTESSVGVGLSGHISGKRKTTHYRTNRVLINRYCKLLGASPSEVAGSPKLQLNVGTHTYPFSFTLPESLPASMFHGGFSSDYKADIKYNLTARIDAPSWVDSTKQAELLVLGHYAPLALLTRALSLPPQPHTLEKSAAFFMKDGRLKASVTLSLPSKDAILVTSPGREISLRLQVQNQTAVALTKVRVLLKTKLTVTSHGKWYSVLHRVLYGAQRVVYRIVYCITYSMVHSV